MLELVLLQERQLALVLQPQAQLAPGQFDGEQLLLRCETGRVDPALVDAVLRGSGLEPVAPAQPVAAAGGALTDALRPLSEQVAALEARAIAAALQASGGNRVAAARTLGISRAKLYHRLVNLSDI